MRLCCINWNKVLGIMGDFYPYDEAVQQIRKLVNVLDDDRLDSLSLSNIYEIFRLRDNRLPPNPTEHYNKKSIRDIINIT